MPRRRKLKKTLRLSIRASHHHSLPLIMVNLTRNRWDGFSYTIPSTEPNKTLDLSSKLSLNQHCRPRMQKLTPTRLTTSNPAVEQEEGMTTMVKNLPKMKMSMQLTVALEQLKVERRISKEQKKPWFNS